MAEPNNIHHQSGTSRSSGTTYGYTESYSESNGDGPTLLELFCAEPEFAAFAKQLRRAAQVLTTADFMRLRKAYDAEWLMTLSEL
jgi:hypothetical protein